MDILIKEMEMPSCCGNCEFNQFHEGNPWTTWYTCMFLNKNTDAIGNVRLADCPLVALPEHGDLIDRDELLTDLADRMCVDDMLDGIYQPAIDRINEAKTVVEANNG